MASETLILRFGDIGRDDVAKVGGKNASLGEMISQLPDGVRVANKPGWLDGVRSDAGIVFVPNRPFAIAVMTTFGRDHAQQELAIARIGRAAYSYFDRVGRSSALGRTMP